MTNYTFTVDWFAPHIEFWNMCLNRLEIDRTSKLQILEVGSYEGRSATWIADNLLNHNDSRLWCIDTFQGSIEHREGTDEYTKVENLENLYTTFLSNIAICNNPNKIITIKDDSQIVMPNLSNNEMKFDIIYIDSSHETEHVLSDGIHAFNMLKPGGLIIFDDYEWSLNGVQTVKAALNKLEAQYTNMKWILSGWQRAYIKDYTGE